VAATLLAHASVALARRSPRNVARAAGLAQVTRSWTANVSNYDGDRDQDLLLVRHNPQWFWNGTPPAPTATLYRNVRKGFVVATTSFGHSDRHDCDFADADRDGDRDLFCAVGLDDSSKNQLWRNTRRGWRDASRTFKLRGSGAISGSGNYRTTTFLRANGDRYPDVYVTRYYGPDGPPLNDPAESPPRPNELYINVRGDHFRRAPGRDLDRRVGAQKDTPGCTQAVDYNNDGRQDLMVCGYRGLHLYRNRRGGFRDVTKRAGIGGFWKDARLARLGGSRRHDLVRIREGALDIRYFARGEWRRRARRSITGGEGVATGDFNGDGRTDIYVLRTCTSGGDLGDRVLLNRGHGNFRTRRIDGVGRGCGNDVEAIDYNEDGRSDFLVLNGKKKTAGPVQLFTFR
jgi:hypothetical protein